MSRIGLGTIVGRLTREPRIGQYPDGSPVVNLQIAVTSGNVMRELIDPASNTKVKVPTPGTDYFGVQCSSGLASKASTLVKGQQVTVHPAHIRASKPYEIAQGPNAGHMAASVEIVADELEIGDAPRTNGHAAPAVAAAARGAGSAFDPEDEEIPFD